jgi:hypothetical protein
MTKLADYSYFSVTGGRTGLGLKSIQSGDILCIFYSGGQFLLCDTNIGATLQHSLEIVMSMYAWILTCYLRKYCEKRKRSLLADL